MWTILIAAVAAAAAPARSNVTDDVVPSRVRSIDLFKNGIAVVRRTVALPGNGTFAITDLPEPVHGTFWVESDAEIETRITTRMIVEPRSPRTGSDLRESLGGEEVLIHFRSPELPPMAGLVLPRPDDAGVHWDRSYERSDRYYGWRYMNQPAPAPRRVDRFLELYTDDGIVLIDTSMIGFVRVTKARPTAARRQPVLLLTASGADPGGASVVITYLTKGIAWAPSYRVDLSDPDTLRLAQKAVIKNELAKLDDVEVRLISGFPSIEFAHVRSPLSPTTSWSTFFQELGRRTQPSHAALSNVMSQSTVSYGPSEGGIDPASLFGGDGVDLHYRSIGRRSLDEGDSLVLTVATGDAPYERIVEWFVPDTRDAYGYRRSQDNERDENGGAWDAVRFANPLDAPMTTGPAMVVANGRFQGERLSNWVAKDETTTLRINKALNVRTLATEHEVPGEREFVWIGTRKYRSAQVNGELLLSNHRDTPLKIVVKRRFSGELLEADGEPTDVLLKEGVWSVNERHELLWTIELAPGETRTLEYRYSVLVRH